jgi:hypothetical protein
LHIQKQFLVESEKIACKEGTSKSALVYGEIEVEDPALHCLVLGNGDNREVEQSYLWEQSCHLSDYSVGG